MAGEIKQPNTYSFRTLEKLKNMTQQEAKDFQMVSSLVLQSGGRKFILSEDSILNKYGVYFSHLLELEECGLMTTQILSLKMVASAKEPDVIYNSELVGLIWGKEEQERTFKMSVYVFTESGSQLIAAIHPQMNSQYIIDCLKLIQDNHNDFMVTTII